MITLAIECSSRQGSIALLKDKELVGEKVWVAERVRHNTIFVSLEELIEEAKISYSDIDMFAVGRGPGSFSGMRMSFAIAHALALPEKKEVRVVSSGAALALTVSREGAKKIAVVGDARRGQVWIGLFKASSEGVAQAEDWELVPYENVSVSKDTVIVSPEAERLVNILPELSENKKNGTDISRFPHAKEVGELSLKGSEELEPLYMHPPVFVEPRC